MGKFSLRTTEVRVPGTTGSSKYVYFSMNILIARFQRLRIPKNVSYSCTLKYLKVLNLVRYIRIRYSKNCKIKTIPGTAVPEYAVHVPVLNLVVHVLEY